MMIDGPWGATNVTNYCDFNVGYSIIPKAEKQVTTINGSALVTYLFLSAMVMAHVVTTKR